MSLKAYDGMMSRKSIKYIQDEIIKRLPIFREISENQLAKKYAELFVDYADNGHDIKQLFEFEGRRDVELKSKINEIEISDTTTVFSYIFQASKILSKGEYRNDFMVHLNMSLQAINNRKILIYPNIIVDKHKDILLEFLQDWYCQNQCDKDENVPNREWNQREKDWLKFDEIQGFNIKIKLFDPSDHWNSINGNFRGQEMRDKVLNFIPSDKDRIRKIARRLLLSKIEKEAKEIGEEIQIWNVINRISNPDNTEIDDYIKSHNINLIKIDNDYLINEKINLLKLERKQKLNELNK